MRITVEAARKFFLHPSQQVEGITPDNLPPEAIYYAQGDVCLIFHGAPWHDTYFVHCAALPRGWGGLDDDTRAVLRQFAEDFSATRIVAWIPGKNRAVSAFANRVGFKRCGGIEMPDNTLEFWEWSPCR